MKVLYLKCKKTLIMSDGVEELTKNKTYKIIKEDNPPINLGYYVLNNSGNPNHAMGEEFLYKHFYTELTTKLYKL